MSAHSTSSQVDKNEEDATYMKQLRKVWEQQDRDQPMGKPTPELHRVLMCLLFRCIVVVCFCVYRLFLEGFL